MKNFDITIIGAGVTGAAIARRLSRYKIKVALIDKEADVSFQTSKANSGIIHAGFHSAPGLLKTELCLQGNRLFDRLREELCFAFERRGELVVAFDDTEMEILRTLYAQGRKNRINYLELIGRERVLEMEPNLNPDVIGALFAPSAGIIEPYDYCFALVENAVANGVELILGEKIVCIRKQTFGGFTLESEQGLRIKTEYLINAAGLFADEITSLVGLKDFSIQPRKGEEYLLDRRVGDLVRRVIFPVPSKSSKGMLVIPTVDGTVMVGPTAQDTTSKTDFQTSRQGLLKVFESAQHMIPAIRSSDVITSFAGLRPVATGDDFIICPTRVFGFINAAGIQSPGLTASPAIAHLVERILTTFGLKFELRRDYRAYRKPTLPFRHFLNSGNHAAINNMIDEDPGYKRLVCRCENVTEAEIRAAIRRGHTTSDGIKFATRAGMGRCQGGFCLYRIMKILHETAGIPMTGITKKGVGSEIIKGTCVKGIGHESKD